MNQINQTNQINQMNDSGETMGIEFSQIHNLVRTYQRIMNVPSGKSPHGDRDIAEAEDRVSISPQAREHEEQYRTDPIPDGFSQQDKERPT
jgi:hypothetical protein